MKLIFDFAAEKIAIEGDEPELVSLLTLARELAPSISSIEITTTKGASPRVENKHATAETPQESTNNGGTVSGKTLRQFARSLSLSSVAEKMAAIAYYVKRFEEKATFSPKEMTGWFGACGFEIPKAMPVAVFNAAKNNRFFSNVGYGQWKLDRPGENFVISKENEAETRTT